MITLTLDYLNNLDICTELLCLFNNTSQLHNLQLTEDQKNIVVSDSKLCNLIIMIVKNTKNHINLYKIEQIVRDITSTTYFDKYGNIIAYKNSLGYWDKSEYNDKGKLISCIDAAGIWEKYEYDKNGNLLMSVNSDNIWHKYTYDENNKLIRAENSYGEINEYVYDRDKNKLIQVISNDSIKNFKYNEDGSILETLTIKNGEYWEEILIDRNGNVLSYDDSENCWEKYEYDSNNKIVMHTIHTGYWEKYINDENGNNIEYYDSYGNWEKKTYNVQGKLLNHKKSNGYNENRIYNDRGELISIYNSVYGHNDYDLSNFEIIYI